MPSRLPPLERTAVVTMEMQRGVVGDRASLPELREAVQATGVLDACASLLGAARGASIPVVHARVEWAADRRGTPLNTPLVAALAKDPAQMLMGTDAVELIPEVGDTSADLHSVRRHGLTPFTGTDLDALLRSIGTRTVVAVGVSLNVGLLGLCLGAADLGYRVVVPTDAVAGVPVDYGEQVLQRSIAMVAMLTTVDELRAHWAAD